MAKERLVFRKKHNTLLALLPFSQCFLSSEVGNILTHGLQQIFKFNWWDTLLFVNKEKESRIKISACLLLIHKWYQLIDGKLVRVHTFCFVAMKGPPDCEHPPKSIFRMLFSGLIKKIVSACFKQVFTLKNYFLFFSWTLFIC